MIDGEQLFEANMVIETRYTKQNLINMTLNIRFINIETDLIVIKVKHISKSHMFTK